MFYFVFFLDIYKIKGYSYLKIKNFIKKCKE